MKILIAILVIGLVGCEPYVDTPATQDRIETIYLEDGTSCAFYQGHHGAAVAMSCDWEGNRD